MAEGTPVDPIGAPAVRGRESVLQGGTEVAKIESIRQPAGTELFEYVCQQMNYAPTLMVGAAKSVDRTSAISRIR